MTRLSLRTKLELIEYHEKNNATLMQTAKKFGTTITTVHKTLKNKCVWVKLYNSVKDGRCKHFSFSENAVIDSELAKWYTEIKNSKHFDGITRLELRKSLNKIVREHKIGFKVNGAWINEFVRKNEVILNKVGTNPVKKAGTSKSERNGKVKSSDSVSLSASSQPVLSPKKKTVKTKSGLKIVKLNTNVGPKNVIGKNNIDKNDAASNKVKFSGKRNIRENFSSKQGNLRTKNVFNNKLRSFGNVRKKNQPKDSGSKKVQKTTRILKTKRCIDTSEINKNDANSLSTIKVVESSSVIQSSSKIPAEVNQNVDDDNNLLLEALKIRRRTSLDRNPFDNDNSKALEADSVKKKCTKSERNNILPNKIGADDDKLLESVSVLPKVEKSRKLSESSKIRKKKISPKKASCKGFENSGDNTTTERTLRDDHDNEPLETNIEILTSLKICRKTSLPRNSPNNEKLSENNIKGSNGSNKDLKSTKVLRKSSLPDKIVLTNYSKIANRGIKSINAHSLNKKSRKSVPTKAEAINESAKNTLKCIKNEISIGEPVEASLRTKKSRNKPTKAENKLDILENGTGKIEKGANKTFKKRKTKVDKTECQVLQKSFNKTKPKLDETECGSLEKIQKSFKNNNRLVETQLDKSELENTNDNGKSSNASHLPVENVIIKPLKKRKTVKVVFNTRKHYRRFTRNTTKCIGATTKKYSRKKLEKNTKTVQAKLPCINDTEDDNTLNTIIENVDNNNEQNIEISRSKTISDGFIENNDENNKIKIKPCYSQESNIAEPKRKRDVFEFDYDEESEANHNIPSKKPKRIIEADLTQSIHKRTKRTSAENATSRITRGRAENFEIQELLPRRRRKRNPRKQIEEPGNIVKLENFIDPIVMSTPLHHEINLSLNKIGFEENIISHTYMESAKGTKKLHKTRKRRSLRINPTINSTTDDDDEQLIDETPKHRRTRRRRRKTPSTKPLVIKTDPTNSVPNEDNLEHFDDTGTFEDASNELDYYETIENDNVVEILCNRNSAESSGEQSQKPTPKRPRKSKIEILSDIKIISGSRNLITKKTRSKSENTPSKSAPLNESSEQHVFKVPATRKNSLPETSSTNFDMSWSNLFPDLDRTVSAEELVNQINEIEFQYDPDAFKNVKIEVLSSGCTDEEENRSLEYDDGAEGDDEFEDDDVPSSQGQPMPPPNQLPQPPPNSMQGGYRPQMPPNGRAPAPRGPQPGQNRMPGGPRPPMNNRAPGVRPRAPMIRPRGAGGSQPIRGQVRPRMSGPQNGVRPGNQTSPIKRSPDLNNASSLQKRKKVDVLAPSDKDDDDCQVICMQPKNTGLPQIESVQGASESVENSIMKLSDSITLSVRNPPPKQAASPQKSDAKAVANVLASRGITVTASGKPKESPTKQAPAIPTALSLNGAVSIVAKNNSAKPTGSDSLPTVDLTDDSSPPSQNSPNRNRPGLPYRCDLCPAQYPNAMGLNKHRQTYHKTTSGMCELGVPLINLKQPGIMQKLTHLGINNYIPLPSAGSEGTYALPIITTKNPGNVAALGASQMLSLGPVRAIPRPGAANNANNAIKK